MILSCEINSELEQSSRESWWAWCRLGDLMPELYAMEGPLRLSDFALTERKTPVPFCIRQQRE